MSYFSVNDYSSKENRAYQLSAKAHAGQIRRDGEAYFAHVCRVAANFKAQSDEIIVAWLHDVVEDSEISLDLIETYFGRDIATAVDAITRRAGETYQQYIFRCSENRLATIVKIADLRDHLAAERVQNIPESMVRKYKKSLLQLEANNDKR